MTRGRNSAYAAIVGIGATEQGELHGKTANAIAVDAFRAALDDAGIDKHAVDGLITCKSFGGGGIDTDVGFLAGLEPRYSATLDYGTCNFSLHLAALVIGAGLADTVALMYGTNQRTAGNRFTGAAGEEDLLAPHGFFNIAGPAALAFKRHQHLYGTSESQLGAIAVNQRRNARLNPAAVFRTPLDLDGYMASRYIVRPLRRPDLCMISDGGACLIMTRTDRVEEFRPRPAHVLGIAEQTGLRGDQHADHLLRPWIAAVADRIYADAGVDRDEVDLLYVQDPTSVWVLQMLEWYGFCPQGEGGAFFEDGHGALDGSLPVNTNGGQLSEAYMWGWLHLLEAVRQLRGEAGERQVAGAQVAQYCSTMAFHKAASSVLGGPDVQI